MAGLVTYSNTPWGKIPTVNYYADLPADPAPYIGRIFLVLNSSGVWLINYHEKGIYYSDGVNWLKKTGIMDQILNGITYTDIPNGMVLGSNGNHVIAVAAGGGGTPGGSDGQMQYNNGGVFGGDAYSYYDDVTGTHAFGAVDDGNYTEIDNTGFITQYKDARTWRECIARWEVPVAWMNNTVAPIWTDGFAGGRDEGYWGFDTDIEGLQKVSFTFELPHDYDEGTNLYPHVHFSNPVTQKPAKLAAVWIMNYWFADVFQQDGAGDVISNFETNGSQVCYMSYQYSLEIGAQLTAWTHLKTQTYGDGYRSIISGEGLKISSIIKGIVYLDISSTTFSRQLALLSIDLHYQANTLGSREERAKGGLGIGTP